MPKTYSTGEAAEQIGVSRQTMQAWIDRECIPVPKLETVGRIKVRLWTAEHIKRAREFKGTLKPGRKPKSRKKVAA
jgi:excisionase family DNA binding protein